MQQAHSKEISSLPIVWMFGKKTEEEITAILQEIGAKSLSECVSIGGGGVMRKCDTELFRDTLARQERERKQFMTEHLFDAILCEMRNHEYGYTHDPEDTLNALGKTRKDLEENKDFNRVWCRAQKICFAE